MNSQSYSVVVLVLIPDTRLAPPFETSFERLIGSIVQESLFERSILPSLRSCFGLLHMAGQKIRTTTSYNYCASPLETNRGCR